MKITNIFSIIVLTALAGCATSAAEIKVPTTSMEEAWKASSSDSSKGADAATGRVVGAVLRQDQPLPVVSAPDIRMAYVFPATDADGNMHYGSWVALPIDSFKWLMPEGGKMPMAPMKTDNGGH
jgi:hypothetical protein